MHILADVHPPVALATPVDRTVDSTVDDVENALIPLVRYLSSTRTWRQLAAATDLSLDRARYVVLRAVAETEPVRTTALAEQLGVDPSTMSRHVSILAAAGLVSRVPDPEDGRAQAVSLTAAGREVMEKVRAARHDLITAAVEGWDDTDRAQLASLVGRLAEDLLRLERDT
jgi:DNA-binding MarR family transcriptional regulator